MAGSGLEEVIKAAFGGVMKMLTGKNFPQNTRALKIIEEQVLHEILCKVNTVNELMRELILPVFLMLMFIRAE